MKSACVGVLSIIEKWLCSAYTLPLLYDSFQHLSRVKHRRRYDAGDAVTKTGDDDQQNTRGMTELCSSQRLGSLCKEQMSTLLLLHWLLVTSRTLASFRINFQGSLSLVISIQPLTLHFFLIIFNIREVILCL